MPRTRDAVQYENMQDKIKSAARERMAAHGTAGINLREIARKMDITAPAIYRYFPSLDDLITALILDSFNGIADAMAYADANVPQENYGVRLYAIGMAYRQWAVDHPVDFQLIYGNPIPGYVAPAEITVPAARRAFVVIGVVLQQAIQAGALKLNPLEGLPPSNAAFFEGIAREYGIPPEAIELITDVWSQMHGRIMLELLHHFDPVVGSSGDYFAYKLKQYVRALGLDPG